MRLIANIYFVHEQQLTCMTLKKTAISISAQSSTMWRKRPVQSVLCAILIVPVKELVQEIDHYLSFFPDTPEEAVELTEARVWRPCPLTDIYSIYQYLHFCHTYSTHSFDFEHDTRVRRSDLLQPAKTGCQQ